MPINNSEVLVLAASATLLLAADAQRTSVTIANQGPNQIVVGGSTVTLKNGIPLAGTATPLTANGGTHTVPTDIDGASAKEAWYAIARTADQVTTTATQITVATR